MCAGPEGKPVAGKEARSWMGGTAALLLKPWAAALAGTASRTRTTARRAIRIRGLAIQMARSRRVMDVLGAFILISSVVLSDRSDVRCRSCIVVNGSVRTPF